MQLEPGSSIWHTHNVWLTAFYFAGIRVSDVIKLRWSDFKDDRLYYVMNKNEKPLSLKGPEKSLTILSFYKNQKDENKGYVFPFLKNVRPNDDEDFFYENTKRNKAFQ